MRQEVDRAKRKLETELQDVKEQLSERKVQVEELQIILSEFVQMNSDINNNIDIFFTMACFDGRLQNTFANVRKGGGALLSVTRYEKE